MLRGRRHGRPGGTVSLPSLSSCPSAHLKQYEFGVFYSDSGYFCVTLGYFLQLCPKLAEDYFPPICRCRGFRIC